MENTAPQFSYAGSQWHLLDDSDLAKKISASNGISLTLALLLANLNLTPGEQTERFLHPSMADLHDPFLMLDMSKAIERFRKTIREKEPIRVVTDYDVDGTMSSLILQGALGICGHTAISYHIPNRKTEGYGFSMAAAQKAIDDGIKLIVTADIGVRDDAPIALAASHGIDVIVLDHHLPPGCGVPEKAYAVLCPPQEGCNYPNKSLAACGISLKFAQALLRDHPSRNAIIRSMMKLAALGTVADVVSLLEPENRAIVTIGLDALNRDAHRPGLKALLEISRTQQGTIDSSAIGYRIGPRINAAGRLASANLIIELLHAANTIQAHALAAQLDAMNEDRQLIQQMMIKTAIETIGDCDDPFIVVALPEDDFWHSGISGIVAGRIREHFHRPVAVATIENGMMTGSIRSTPGVHAVQALTSVSALLTKFGGHAAAAGFSCPADALDALRKGLCQNALNQLNGNAEIPTTEIALCLAPEELDDDVFEAVQRLEPCGAQNNRPTVCIRNAVLRNIVPLKDIHLRGTLANSHVSCLWFSAPVTPQMLESKPHHIIGELVTEMWNGSPQHKILIRDACPADRDVFI